MALKRIILFVLILSVFFVYAIPLAPSPNQIDSSDDIAEDRIKRDVSSLEQNGGIDREKRDANDDASSDSTDEALEEESEERLRKVRQVGDDGKDNDDDDNDDDGDDSDLEEVPKIRDARETDDDNEDDDEDDLEEDSENREAREADDDTEDDEDDDDDLEEDSENREAREANDDNEEEDDDDDEDGDNDDDKKNEIERELNELDALAGSRKKRDVAPKPTAPAGTKPAAHINNTKCTRSITLEDLDKLLKEDDSEDESRNKRNMEDEGQDDDDDDDEDFDDFLSRKRRDVGEDDDDDDDDEEEENDEDRRKRDTDDDDYEEDEDEDDEDEVARKKRGEDDDNEDDDEDEYLQNLMRIMRDTEGSEVGENREEKKEQPIVTRDLEATNNAEVEDKNSQADSYVDQKANSPEGFQNLAKRADYDYPGDEDSDLDVNVNKRDEEFNQGLSEDSEEMNHRFLESNEEKSKRKPIVSSIVIDEPDDFSLIETGNETKVIINSNPSNNAAQTTANEPADSNQPGYTNTLDINENTVYPDGNKSERPRQQRSESRSKLAGNSQRAYWRREQSHDRAKNGINKRVPNRPNSGLPENAGEPRGPIALENKLSKAFAGMFYQNPKVNIQWIEPDTLGNCWVHAMLAHTLDSGFSPSCNQDGSYSPKQCFLQRCWCVSRDGSPEDPNFNTRFAYTIKGAMLKCTQVYR